MPGRSRNINPERRLAVVSVARPRLGALFCGEYCRADIRKIADSQEGGNMKKLMFCLLLACFSLTLAMAQQDASGSKDKSGTRTVAGCLQKADQANHFQLKGKDGSSWDLTSDNVS